MLLDEELLELLDEELLALDEALELLLAPPPEELLDELPAPPAPPEDVVFAAPPLPVSYLKSGMPHPRATIDTAKSDAEIRVRRAGTMKSGARIQRRALSVAPIEQRTHRPGRLTRARAHAAGF